MPSSDPEERAQNILRGLSEHEAERSSRLPDATGLSRTRTLGDSSFLGALALQRNLIRPDQLEACLKEQTEARAKGMERSVGQILLAREWLTPAMVAELEAEERRLSQGFPTLSRFEIRRCIGEGASAVVYGAWDRELRRNVALKVLRNSVGLSTVARERFRREAQATAGLVHPNVVVVHDAGEENGQLYLLMELVEGRPLSEKLKDGSLSRTDALALLEKATRGVAAAHEKGIIHRDLKPANLLVTSTGDPKVGDFGLAHLGGERTELTRTGSTLGTPLYMSPEQVEGRTRDVSPRTDVYALGAILYEILTGRPPHVSEVTMDLYRSIVHDAPAPPRRLRPDVPAELEAIALKALEKDPSRRYPTAGELADDLARYRTGEPVHARPPGLLTRIRRRLVKRRSALAMAGVLLLAGGVTWWALGKANFMTPEAEAYHSTWKSAMDRAGLREFPDAIRELEEALPKITDPELRRAASLDVDLLRRADGTVRAVLEHLARWPYRQSLSVEFRDRTGALTRLDQPVLRTTPDQVDLEKETGTLTVEIGEITGRALGEISESLSPQGYAANRLGPAILFAIDGDPIGARKALGSKESIPEKYWVYCLSHERSALPPQRAEKELAARQLFQAAEAEYREFRSRAPSASKFSRLLADHAETDFVRRNRSFLESRRNAGKEYAFTYARLATRGAWKPAPAPAPVPEQGWSWTCVDVGSPRVPQATSVDLVFSALPETAYRCWVYVGGCCAETIRFRVQSTGDAERPPPGPRPDLLESKTAPRPVVQEVLTSPAHHADHPEKDPPLRWGWVEIPLPRFGSGGPKVVRILPDRAGFHVAYAEVSSLRSSPPGDAERDDAVRGAEGFHARGAVWLAAADAAELQSPMARGNLYIEGAQSPLLLYPAMDNRSYPASQKEGQSPVALRADTNDGGWARYEIDLPADGEWFLWARLFYPGGSVVFRGVTGVDDDPNSFYVSVDGGKEQILGNLSYHAKKMLSYFRRWHWDGNSEAQKAQEPAPMALGHLARGRHTLRIRNRESVETTSSPISPRIDLLCLTPDPAYVPRDEDVRR
jgi:serine/threonine-protein kinase